VDLFDATQFNQKILDGPALQLFSVLVVCVAARVSEVGMRARENGGRRTGGVGGPA
jgi:hypothetical protein